MTPNNDKPEDTGDMNQSNTMDDLRKQLENSKTFNYNVYGGVNAFDNSLTFEQALDEITALITALITAKLQEVDRVARIRELEMLPRMRKGLHTPQKDLDIILADTVDKRLASLKGGDV